MINRFEDEYSFLSNFYTLYVTYQGSLYPSVGHAFTASKTRDMGKRLQIATAVTAREIINIERKLPKQEWFTEDYQLQTMKELLTQKFSVPAIRKLLASTGSQELVYGNSPDEFWGINERTGVGHNHLGKLLMEVRNSL